MLHLFADDEEWHHCLAEAALCKMQKQLRMTFDFILVFASPLNAMQLWQDFSHAMSEDFLRH